MLEVKNMESFIVSQKMVSCLFLLTLVTTLVMVYNVNSPIFHKSFFTQTVSKKKPAIVPFSTEVNDKISKKDSSGPVEISQKSKFQQINDYNAYVFSAFYHIENGGHVVRIFGVQEKALQAPIFCRVTENGTARLIRGMKTVLTSVFTKRFHAYSYHCNISSGSRPESVSLTFGDIDVPTNRLPVLYPLPRRRNFTVCHAVIYNFHKPQPIIQSFEFNRVLGAEHFFVYRHSTSKEVDVVFKHYQKLGLLTVIQWQIPVADIHYRGQLLAINDCVYRNKEVSRFVVVQDTDEFIIPYHHDNWWDMITDLDSYYSATKCSYAECTQKPGTYVFRSTFFYDRPYSPEWADIKRTFKISEQDGQLLEKHSLTAFTHLRRLKYDYVRTRTKVVVRPELIVLAGIHVTQTHLPSADTMYVDTQHALVHHQRYTRDKSEYFVETSSMRFIAKVLSHVNMTFSNVFA